MTSNHHNFDIIAFGQSFVDLIGEQIGSTLTDMLSFTKHVGGISSLAIALSRLGLKTALITNLGQDDFGKDILQALQNERIDTSQIQIDKENQTSLRFRTRQVVPMEMAYGPNSNNILEKETSASFIKSSKSLIFSSNFNCKNWQEATLNLLTLAKPRQAILVLEDTVAIDNPAFKQLLPLCSLIIGYEHAFQSMNGEKDTHAALNHLRQLTDAMIVLKSSDACFVFLKENSKFSEALHFKACNEESTSLITKQAFMVGFIHGWLKDYSFEKCVQYANVCLYLAQSRDDNSNSLPCIEELNLYLSSQHQVVQTSLTPLFEHIHYAATRHAPQAQLFTFSFGSHQQWLKLAQMANVDEATIIQAKKIITIGIQHATNHFSNTSIMCDALDEKGIIDLMPNVHRMMRSFEIRSENESLNKDLDITATLRKWPKHHSVNLAFVYHPDDRYALRQQQETYLSQLYKATRKTTHELLIELAPPANSLITASTYAHIMKRLYEIGIYPDWWQLSHLRDQRSFDSMQRVIAENDRSCQGIIVLTPQATFDQLPIIFNNTAKHPLCKGFVVGKNIVQHEINQWLSQKINAEVLSDSVTTNFEKAITLWLQAKEAAANSKKIEETA